MESKSPSQPFGMSEEVLEYFERGKTFTAELMMENERLRMRELKLEKELMDIKATADPELLKQALEENRKLINKLDMFENRFMTIEKENKDFANRYVDVQVQNDNLLNLYVSSYQLHSTLDTQEVVKVIQEIILNLIGAEEYYVCMLNTEKQNLTIVVGEGAGERLEGREILRLDPVLASVLRDGKTYFKTEKDADSSHMACTPLKVKNDIVGAISITKLFDQKKGVLTAIDHELLSLLADHAATALVSSKLYNRIARKLETVEGFLDMLAC